MDVERKTDPAPFPAPGGDRREKRIEREEQIPCPFGDDAQAFIDPTVYIHIGNRRTPLSIPIREGMEVKNQIKDILLIRNLQSPPPPGVKVDIARRDSLCSSSSLVCTQHDSLHLHFLTLVLKFHPVMDVAQLECARLGLLHACDFAKYLCKHLQFVPSSLHEWIAYSCFFFFSTVS